MYPLFDKMNLLMPIDRGKVFFSNLMYREQALHTYGIWQC